jgi:hypothetical protein
MPVILAIWEAEVGESCLLQKHETLTENNKLKEKELGMWFEW